MLMASNMNVIVTHIFREGNDSADSLANAGLIINDIMYFWEPPACIVNSVHRNKLGMPSFRFTSF
jgi:hypothetical protein